jgi:hypothetical protein
MEKALYHEAENKPFGCEFLISGNGEKRRVLVYIGDETVNLDTVRYEPSDDKDLIYTVVSKSVKKDLGNIRYRDMGDL